MADESTNGRLWLDAPRPRRIVRDLGACADCAFFCPFPWTVRKYDGYCGRREVSRSQVDALFVTDSRQAACRYHVPLAAALPEAAVETLEEAGLEGDGPWLASWST